MITCVSAKDKAAAFLKYLGISLYSSRKVTQKAIYLLQRMGIDLGYSFCFHIYGPYSKDLVIDLEAAKCDKQDYEPNEEEKRALDRLKSMIDELPSGALDYWMQLLGSLEMAGDPQRLKLLRGKIYPDEDIQRAYHLLNKYIRAFPASVTGRCPNCRSPITSLLAYSLVEVKQEVRMGAQGVEWMEISEVEDTRRWTNFKCPNCGEIIYANDGNVKDPKLEEILRGEEN
ncbi:MAG: hypothetical protein QXG08_01045 [Candidatus Methanomethyliaceae archaeon]